MTAVLCGRLSQPVVTSTIGYPDRTIHQTPAETAASAETPAQRRPFGGNGIHVIIATLPEVRVFEASQFESKIAPKMRIDFPGEVSTLQ